MCTLSQDDTQSTINPHTATAPQDKWKPPPPKLPATPPPPCPPAVTVKVTQSNVLCEGAALFIFHHCSPVPHTAGVEDVPSERVGDQHSEPTWLSCGKTFIYSGSSLINFMPEVKKQSVYKNPFPCPTPLYSQIHAHAMIWPQLLGYSISALSIVSHYCKPNI